MRGILWLLLVTVGCAAIVFISSFLGDDSPESPPPVAASNTGSEPVAAPPPEPSPTPAIPPPEIVAPEAPPPVLVDSFPADTQPRVEGWATVSDLAGHLDVVSLAGVGSPIDDANALRTDQMIVAQGWAGDASLGIRYSDVLLSMCGRFVARAQVGVRRPDVAKVVHPNLEESGWSATIHIRDLPNCANPELRAWAVVPGQPAAIGALVGTRRINVVERVDGGAEHVSAQVPVNPFEYWPYDSTQFRVTASRANMRRCAGTGCAVVAKIDRGTYSAVVMDRADGWTLLVLEDRAGWLFDELFEKTP